MPPLSTVANSGRRPPGASVTTGMGNTRRTNEVITMAKAKRNTNHTHVAPKVYAGMPEISGTSCEVVPAKSRLTKAGQEFPSMDMLLVDRLEDSGKRLWMKGMWLSHAKARAIVEHFDDIAAWGALYKEKTSARKGVVQGKDETLKDALIKRASGDMRKCNAREKAALSKHDAATLKLLS